MADPITPPAGSTPAGQPAPSASPAPAAAAPAPTVAAAAAQEADAEKKPILRMRAIEAERKVSTLESELKTTSERAKAADEFKSKYEGQLKSNALLLEASKLGLKNPDFLKLVDTSKVTLEGDAVKGADVALQALQKAHPDLFGPPDPKTLKPGVTAQPPAGGTSSTFDPNRDYSADEIRSFKPEQLAEWKRANGHIGRMPGKRPFGG
jgi:hypothetical protein